MELSRINNRLSLVGALLGLIFIHCRLFVTYYLGSLYNN
jgi:hypothetical protein